jgi:hypothetical protein
MHPLDPFRVPLTDDANGLAFTRSPGHTPGSVIRVVISYRRADSSAYAGRLRDALDVRLEDAEVFMDIDDLEPGADFVEAIDSAIASCDFLLAVIGPQWTTIADSAGKPRLRRGNDHVRLEIESALKLGRRVIPVLVGEADMPASTELPRSLAALARRQAIELSDTRWGADVERLLAVLQRPRQPSEVASDPVEAAESAPPEASTPVSPPLDQAPQSVGVSNRDREHSPPEPTVAPRATPPTTGGSSDTARSLISSPQAHSQEKGEGGRPRLSSRSIALLLVAVLGTALVWRGVFAPQNWFDLPFELALDPVGQVIGMSGATLLLAFGRGPVRQIGAGALLGAAFAALFGWVGLTLWIAFGGEYYAIRSPGALFVPIGGAALACLAGLYMTRDYFSEFEKRARFRDVTLGRLGYSRIGLLGALLVAGTSIWWVWQWSQDFDDRTNMLFAVEPLGLTIGSLVVLHAIRAQVLPHAVGIAAVVVLLLDGVFYFVGNTVVATKGGTHAFFVVAMLGLALIALAALASFGRFANAPAVSKGSPKH